MTSGIVSFNKKARLASGLTTEELVRFVFKKVKSTLVHGSGKIYEPAYLFEQVLIYMVSGTRGDFTFITSDHGLNYAVFELRKRLLAGQFSGIALERVEDKVQKIRTGTKALK